MNKADAKAIIRDAKFIISEATDDAIVEDANIIIAAANNGDGARAAAFAQMIAIDPMAAAREKSIARDIMYAARR